MLLITSTKDHLVAAKQEPYQKPLSLKKLLKFFFSEEEKPADWASRQKSKSKKYNRDRATGAGRGTKEVEWVGGVGAKM